MDSTEPAKNTGQAPTALWAPSTDRIANAQIDQFRRDRYPDEADSDGLWEASVRDPGAFWRNVWEWTEIIGDPGERDLETAGPRGDRFRHARFLPDATLNFAENLLAERPGRDDTAIVALTEPADAESAPVEERWSWERLRAETAAMAACYRHAGVQPGDRIAAWMPHRAETIVAFLAAASVGAVFTSTSADFGAGGVIDRFGQTEPVILLAADAYQYGGKVFPLNDRLTEIAAGLPSLNSVILVETGLVASGDNQAAEPDVGGRCLDRWRDLIEQYGGAEPQYEQLPTDHPLYILYSSGTTGKPKCIVHRTGGVLLKHLTEQRFHCDVTAGDQVFFFTTCGWMMWNWLVSALGCGATIVLYDGNPAFPGPGVLFEAAERHGITLFGISAKFIDSVMKSGYRPRDEVDLHRMRSVCSTGSPLSHEGFAWVYEALAPDVHLASMSGGTDLCGCLVLGDPTKPVYAGQIQAKALGLETDVFTDEALPAGPGVKGELVCSAPFPSMPLEFWGDEGESRYEAAYFERFEDQVWAHGDFAAFTDQGGMVIFGRSDATLNASGVRIGTAEIYRVVEQLPEVVEAIAIAQQWENDTRIVLFVRLADNALLTDDLQATMRRELRSKASPRHVPAVIAAVTDIPRTRSGKIVELAVTQTVHGEEVRNTEALANPEALNHFVGHPALVS